MNRKRYVAVLLICLLLQLQAAAVSASPYKIGITLTHPDDGVFCSELVYDDQVIWRLQFLADGAKSVLSGGGSRTTIVVPDIVNGLFLLKINPQ